MKDVITYLVKQLIRDTDTLSVSYVTLDEKTVIQVQVASYDIPRVIGEQGKVFRSLRNVATLVGTDVDDVVVEIAP